MAFFGSPTNSSFGNPNDLVAQARRAGMSDDQIMQLLLESGMDPNAADLNVPASPLSSAPPSIIPRQELQTFSASDFPAVQPEDFPSGMGTPFAPPRPTTPPAPMTPNNARVGSLDDSYGDYSRDTFDQRIAAAAEAYGVPQDIATGLFNVENRQRNPYAINGEGSTAIGLGQLTEAAREDYNRAHGTNFTREDFFDPDLNLDATFWYLTTRDGATIEDQLRAYNQGNGGMRRGLGHDYLAKVRGEAGAPPSPMTGDDGTSLAAAPQAYDELDAEVMPPAPEQVLLPEEPAGAVGSGSDGPLVGGGWNPNAARMNRDMGLPAEPEGGLSSDPKESPNFIQKLMGALSGPMGEGLMGMGAGILGARGTYGNTFQAIGQGGQQGLEAYGYAQRRAQRDREAAAAAKLAADKLKDAEEARRFTRTNMKMQTLGVLADKFGSKAMVNYLRANPDLLAQFGGQVDPSMFQSKDGWTTHVSNGYIIRTNKSGESQLTKLPDDLKVSGITEIEEGGKNVKIAYDQSGKRVSTLGNAPTDKDKPENVQIVEARPSWDQESGITVMHRKNADGTLTPLHDENGQPRYGAQGGAKFERGPDGKIRVAPKDAITDSYRSKLREDIARYQIVAPQVRGLIGDRDANGKYVGGMMTDDVLGMAKDVALRKRGWEAQVPALRRIFNPSMRPTQPADGEDETKRFTRDKWFNTDRNKVSESDYLLSALAFQLAIASNPDGRISDADMVLARQRLGGKDWALSSADDVRERVASFAREMNQRAVSAYMELGQEDQMPNSLRSFYREFDEKDMQPRHVARRKELLQKWDTEAPPEQPAAPAASQDGAGKQVIVRNKETGERKVLPPGVKLGPDSKYEVVK